MKTILLLLLFSVFIIDHEPLDKKIEQHKKETEKAKIEIDFKTQIQPILERRCSPCHFPGGKMYERLPFDTPSTILIKKESILKRIKDEAENKLLREFVEQNK
jgi:hypothetical protein